MRYKDETAAKIENHYDVGLKKTQALARKREELEAWRQAYNVATMGLWSEPQAECPAKVAELAVEIADQALADYRAKRSELLGEFLGEALLEAE